MQKGREGPRGDGGKHAAVLDNKSSEASWPQTLALRRAGNRRVRGQLHGSVGPVSRCCEGPGRDGVGARVGAAGVPNPLGTSPESAVTSRGAGFPHGRGHARAFTWAVVVPGSLLGAGVFC